MEKCESLLECPTNGGDCLLCEHNIAECYVCGTRKTEKEVEADGFLCQCEV